ncbi:hypothetical protein OUZ56_022823 [Daphnia magna]|uniref:Secreted protein n=1 Tax=Daphnia magna TaxID=35525 RepID=A0ABR0AXQ1_9CRUS|nr:hypothetical protein OUZ56_022823 [Daphnia magna]
MGATQSARRIYFCAFFATCISNRRLASINAAIDVGHRRPFFLPFNTTHVCSYRRGKRNISNGLEDQRPTTGENDE